MIDDIKQRLADGEALLPLEVNALLSDERVKHFALMADLKGELAKIKNTKVPMGEEAATAISVVAAVIGVVAIIVTFIITLGWGPDDVDTAGDIIDEASTVKHYGADHRSSVEPCMSRDGIRSALEQLDAACTAEVDE